VYFLGVKGGRCVRLTTLPPSYAVVMKSGNLNFLEPSGPLQACNGTACFTVLLTLLQNLHNFFLCKTWEILHLQLQRAIFLLHSFESSTKLAKQFTLRLQWSVTRFVREEVAIGNSTYVTALPTTTSHP